MPDPYEYDPSMDADIFDNEVANNSSPYASRKQHKHTIDGTICPTCNVVHSVPPNSFSPQEIEQMLSFVDNLPDELVKALLTSGSMRTPVYAEMLTGFLDYSAKIDEAYDIAPLMRAAVEVLDDLTDGKVTKRWRIYEIERRIITTHVSLKAVKSAIKDNSQHQDEEEPHVEFNALLGFLEDFLIGRVTHLNKAYVEEAESVGYEPVQRILDEGLYPEDFVEVKSLMFSQILDDLTN